MKPSDSSSPPLLTSLLPVLSRPRMLAKLKAIVHVFKSLSSFAAAKLFWSKWRLIIIDEISFKVMEAGELSACKIFHHPAQAGTGEWGTVRCREVRVASTLKLCKSSASPLQSLSINKYLYFELAL